MIRKVFEVTMPTRISNSFISGSYFATLKELIGYYLIKHDSQVKIIDVTQTFDDYLEFSKMVRKEWEKSKKPHECISNNSKAPRCKTCGRFMKKKIWFLDDIIEKENTFLKDYDCI